MVVPLGKYMENHGKFGSKLDSYPKVFATNYFLKSKGGKYLNVILDKLIWVIWSEGRVHNDFEAIMTPIGFIPKYLDLKALFMQYLDKEYKEEDYNQQFSIRPRKILEKLDRIEEMYKKEKNVPEFFWSLLNNQRLELTNLLNEYVMDEIPPYLLK